MIARFSSEDGNAPALVEFAQALAEGVRNPNHLRSATRSPLSASEGAAARVGPSSPAPLPLTSPPRSSAR